MLLLIRSFYRRWAGGVWGGDTAPDAVHYARTDDGWRLALQRYEPAVLRPARRPLLLVHGIATNSRNFDLDTDNSLARWLRDRGHDVWLLDLRGCGDSRHVPPGQSLSAISFDDFVEHDAPAAVARVLRSTGADAVHWIGYSMGGMIGAAAMAAGTVEALASLTMIGSPMSFEAGPLGLHAAWARMVSAPLGALPLRSHAQRVVPAAGRIDPPWARLAINFANVEPSVLRTAMQVMVEDIPRDLLGQFANWIRQERGPCSRDEQYDYCVVPEGELPRLFIAGTDDRLGPVGTIAELAEQLGDRAHVHVVGRSAQDQAGTLDGNCTTSWVETEHEWGHADLIMGREAPAHVYETIETFVQGVDEATPDSGGRA